VSYKDTTKAERQCVGSQK